MNGLEIQGLLGIYFFVTSFATIITEKPTDRYNVIVFILAVILLICTYMKFSLLGI